MTNQTSNLRIPLQETPYWEYFDDMVGLVEVSVMPEVVAKRLWSERINSQSSSYFDLPDHSWLVTGTKTPVGHWLSRLNAGESERFEQELTAASPWDPRDHVYFFANSTTALTCRWSEFKKRWTGFVLLESDGAIVIPDEPIKQCIWFKALGDASYIAGDDRYGT